MDLTLYHHNSSVCAAKIRVALADKGLDWTGRLLRLDGDQFDAAYLALNPAAVVPTLTHGGATITESNVILEYLDDAFPDRPLRPTAPADRAAARALIMRLDAGSDSLHHAASVLTYAIAYPMRLVAAGGTDPDRLGPVIAAQMTPESRRWLEEIVYRGVRAPMVAVCLARFDRLLAGFETRRATERWLTGPRHSVSEVAYFPYMIRLEMLHLTFLWRDRPHVAAWLDGLKARPSTAEVTSWYSPENRAVLAREGAARAAETEALLHG